MMLKEIASFSFIGTREEQQDFYYYNNKSIIVADGFGKSDENDFLSRKIIKKYREIVSSEIGCESMLTSEVLFQRIKKGIEKYNTVYTKKVGSTMVIVRLLCDKISFIHIGDSRAYLIRNGFVIWSTKDHSYVQELFDAELISEEEKNSHPKRNVLTKYMSSDPQVNFKAFIKEFNTIQSNDRIFVCTDGVIDTVGSSELNNLLTSSIINNNEILTRIENICLSKSKDNSTAVIATLIL